MGMTTNITISNDSFHDLEKDPKKFVAAINEGMNDSFVENEDKRARRNYVMVHRATHASTLQIIGAQDGASWPLHEGRFLVEHIDGSSNGVADRPGTRKILCGVLDQAQARMDELRDALDRLDENDQS